MRTNRLPNCVASVICASAMLLQISPAMAGDDRHDRHGNRPVDVTFTKWVIAPPTPPAPQPPFALLSGVTGGDIAGTFVGEVLWGQTSLNGHVRGIEAMYEVNAEKTGRSFSALIRGGQNAAGLGRFDGVVMAGWRSGARVQVVYQRYFASDPLCLDAGAPATANCFVGTIRVWPVPRD